MKELRMFRSMLTHFEIDIVHLGGPIMGSNQRWASTLANRSNARHRSNIRAPPRPLPPDLCIQSVGICVARGAGSNLQLAEVLGCHIFVPAPHAPPPKGRGQRSKVVILPTTGSNTALVYEPKCVGRGGGSCGVSANEYSCKQEPK
jgi:hypothetical protein